MLQVHPITWFILRNKQDVRVVLFTQRWLSSWPCVSVCVSISKTHFPPDAQTWGPTQKDLGLGGAPEREMHPYGLHAWKTMLGSRSLRDYKESV